MGSKIFWLYSLGSLHAAPLPSSQEQGQKSVTRYSSDFLLKTLWIQSGSHSLTAHGNTLWNKFNIGWHHRGGVSLTKNHCTMFCGELKKAVENSNSWGNQLGLALDLVCLGIKHNWKMEKLFSFLCSFLPSARRKSDLKEVERGPLPLSLSFCLCWGRKIHLPVHFLPPSPLRLEFPFCTLWFSLKEC